MTVDCPICGQTLKLVRGDTPMGTETINRHFARKGCNDQGMPIAEDES